MVTTTRQHLHTLEMLGTPMDPAAPEDAITEVLQQTRQAPLVLLGEATHGSHEFYSIRARITQRLIERNGFSAVALEADWPDAYRINRFVRGMSEDADARDALGDFERFPRWMWRNHEMLEFVAWLAEYNRQRPPEQRIGVYGLDLYSLHRSIDAVINYLREHDPEAAERAMDRYSCFEQFDDDPQRYGYASHFGMGLGCRDEAIHCPGSSTR